MIVRLLMPRVMLRALVCLFLLGWPALAHAGIDRWTSAGPYGGAAGVIAIDPQAPSTIYAAGNGGLFKSTDGGSSWVPSSSGITDLSIRAVVVDPQSSAILYAGTDQGGGVFKSSDGGASWTALHSAPGVVDGLFIDPQTPTTVYALEEEDGLFKSVDGGQTFTPIGGSSGLPTQDTQTALVLDPKTPTTLYALGKQDGIYKSTDGGNSWLAANAGIAGSAIDAMALAINPQSTSTLYAAIASVGGNSGIYQSTNGGGSWTLVNSQFAAQIGNGFVLALDPVTPSRLYAGLYGAGAYISTDGGTNFTAIDNGLGTTASLGFSALAVNPQTPSTVYAATSSGLFTSTNAGAAWSATNTGIALNVVNTVVVDPLTPTTIYAGTAANGIYKSADGGGSWTQSNAGLTSNAGTAGLAVSVLAIDPVNSANLYLTGTTGGLFKSANGGASWAASSVGLPQYVPITSIAIDASSPSSIYVGTSDDGVFASADGGASWAAANDGLPAGESIVSLSAAASQGVPTLLLVSTATDGLFIGTNSSGSGAAARPAAVNWSQVPLPQRDCDDTLHHDQEALVAGAGTDAYTAVYKVYEDCENHNNAVNGFVADLTVSYLKGSAAPTIVAPNFTATATAMNWGATDGAYPAACAPLSQILVNPLDPTSFYASGDCGVLVGTNSGAQVVSMSLGLPPGLPANSLAITANGSDLYAGTNGGVYRYSFADSPLAAAVVPSSRSAEVGSTVTSFATMINGGTTAASGCGLAPSTALPADFFFQTTAAGTNALTGSRNATVTIPAGGFQTFVLGYTPSASFAPIDAQIDFSCTGLAPAAVLPGIDTLLLSGSTTPVPDLVALLATASNDGIVHIPGSSGSAAFAVATINLGAGDTITASAISSDAALPLSLAVCQSNPANGQCLGTPAASLSTSVAAQATPTFSFFATASGGIPLAPASSRIVVQFTDSTGAIRGQTSVAVETQ